MHTDLNLSNNEIYKLPDEFAGLTLLVRLDISNNYLLNLPTVLFKLPKLRQLRAHHNAIIGMSENIYSLEAFNEPLFCIILHFSRLQYKPTKTHFNLQISTVSK